MPLEGLESLEVQTSKLAVLTGPVGVGAHEAEASYVLVDVVNGGDRDLQVTLSGRLLGQGGHSLGELRPEVLLVPGHGVRTFALVSRPPRVIDGATRAALKVTRSKTSSYPPTVVVEDGHVFDDRDKVVATGRAVNKREARAQVVVIAGFYDADRRPMKRAFTLLEIDGGQSHALRFVGPVGSKSAYIFVGDVTY